ncbi:DUF6362 family protein [Roseibium sp.]|uniref:DUF6362 family protein n=1 Tax=Roseibium sp. TaxID=1936156 RepID=UPI003D0BB601
MIPDTPEEIFNRLIEAVEVIAVVGKADGPRNVLTAWPEYKGRIARRRRTFHPREISRAEEALTWFAEIEDCDSRRALQFEIMCKAGGGKFSEVCRTYGWKRSTVTSRNRAALKRLASRLGDRLA